MFGIFKRNKKKKQDFTKAAYSGIDVALYIIKRSHKIGHNISYLKLGKVMYFIQASYCINRNMLCFKEKLEATEHGPDCPEITRHWKGYGSMGIHPRDPVLLLETEDLWSVYEYSYKEDAITDKDKELMDTLIKMCSEYSNCQLKDITLNQKPYITGYYINFNKAIRPEQLVEYFKEEEDD